jgi:hypothetical protein
MQTTPTTKRMVVLSTGRPECGARVGAVGATARRGAITITVSSLSVWAPSAGRVAGRRLEVGPTRVTSVVERSLIVGCLRVGPETCVVRGVWVVWANGET